MNTNELIQKYENELVTLAEKISNTDECVRNDIATEHNRFLSTWYRAQHAKVGLVIIDLKELG